MDIFLQLPTTQLGWLLNIVLGGVGAVLLMSFIEVILHGYFMHQRILPRFVYRMIPLLEKHVHEHRELHHDQYYKQFDSEPDLYGRDLNLVINPLTVLFGAVVFLPFYLFIALHTSIVPYIAFVIVMLLHMVAWGMIHTEMHKPRHPWWSKTSIFKFLARHHYLHHFHTRRHEPRNFNVVLPFWDFVLRTASTGHPEAEPELKRLGYLP